MSDAEITIDPALRAANLAITGYKRREVSRLTALELRHSSPIHEQWEAIALFAVAVAATLGAVGVWLL